MMHGPINIKFMFLSLTKQAASLPQRLIGQYRLQKKSVYSDNCMQRTNTLCEHNTEFFMIKHVAQIITTVMEGVDTLRRH